MKKKFLVFGHTTVTVSALIEVDIDENDSVEDIADQIYEHAADKFGGIDSFAGNGGLDKLIGVTGAHESISADEAVEWDDFEEE